MTTLKPEFYKELKSGTQLGFQIGNQDSRAASERFGEVIERDKHFLEEEVDDGLEVVGNVSGEEFRVHVENPADGRAGEAEGEQVVFEGEERGQWGAAEIGVLVEGFLGIYFEGLEVEDLLVEEEAGVGGSGGDVRRRLNGGFGRV